MKKTLLTLFAGVACAISAYAIPAHKGLVTVNQPDGTPVTIQLIGDEYFHYTTTSDGYTVERNDAGYFVYMQKVNGAMVATNVVAHNAANRTAEETQWLTMLQAMPKHSVPIMRKFSEQSLLAQPPKGLNTTTTTSADW